MWSGIGVALALGVAIVAALRRRRGKANFYESDVYGMTPTAHGAYALVSAGFALAFAASFLWPTIPAVPLLAIYAVIAILFLSSFVRGATGEDE